MSIQDEGLTETGTLQRYRFWESMGQPISPKHMDQGQYQQQYQSRQTFVNRQVFNQAQGTMRTIFCPSCITEDPAGRITGTRLFTAIEDDVMTTFKALAHFTCHHCGFDEYHPMKSDPRVNQAAGMAAQQEMTATEIKAREREAYMQMQRMNMVGAMYGSAGLASGLGLGLADSNKLGPIGSAIPGATDKEQAALQRIINEAYKSRKP